MVDRDRLKGAAKAKSGALKKAAGKLSGDEKLKRAGQNEELRGKAQNTVGGLKDALRDRTGRSSS
ncbi:MAG: CsbD family protein [Steroidobacteraceae bacterium]